MTDPTPTETLRAAATKLREMAEAATTGPWTWDGDMLVWPASIHGEPVFSSPIIGGANADEDARLIATLGPTFAVLVADWLDAAAWFLERSHSASNWSRAVTERRLRHQMLIARHVLGEAS